MSGLKVGEPYTCDLGGCARCRGDGHRNLTFEPLDHPVYTDEGKYEFTHWAPCSTNGQPILMCAVAREDVT